jgi:hypothetical protein
LAEKLFLSFDQPFVLLPRMFFDSTNRLSASKTKFGASPTVFQHPKQKNGLIQPLVCPTNIVLWFINGWLGPEKVFYDDAILRVVQVYSRLC